MEFIANRKEFIDGLKQSKFLTSDIKDVIILCEGDFLKIIKYVEVENHHAKESLKNLISIRLEPYKLIMEGQFSVNINWLLKILNEIDSVNVTFKLSDKFSFKEKKLLLIKYNNDVENRSCYIYLQIEDTTYLPYHGQYREYMDHILKLDPKQLLKSLESASKHVYRESDVYSNSYDFLRSILFEVKDGKLNIVSTNKRIMCFHSIKMDDNNVYYEYKLKTPDLTKSDPLFKFLLPYLVFKKLDWLKSNLNYKVQVFKLDSSSGNQSIIFKINNIDVVADIINHKYIDYQSYYDDDKENDKSVCIEKKSLDNGLKKLKSDFKKRKNDDNRIDFLFNKDELIIRSIDNNSNVMSQEAVVCNTKEKISISFNIVYIINIINSIDEEKVEMRIKDDRSPVFIKGVGSSNHNFIIMPMKYTEI